jgi:hypothetical protein
MKLSEAVTFTRAMEAAGFNPEAAAELAPDAMSSWKYDVVNGIAFAITPDGARRPLREHIESEWPSLIRLIDAGGDGGGKGVEGGEGGKNSAADAFIQRNRDKASAPNVLRPAKTA